jgi:hypothetical protein
MEMPASQPLKNLRPNALNFKDFKEHLANSASVGQTEMQFIAADAGGIDVETGLAIKIEPHPCFYTDLRSQCRSLMRN